MEPELSIVTWHDITHDVIKARQRKTPAPIHSGPHRMAPGRPCKRKRLCHQWPQCPGSPRYTVRVSQPWSCGGPCAMCREDRESCLVSRCFHRMWMKCQKRDSSSRTGHLWTPMEDSGSGKPFQRDIISGSSAHHSLGWGGLCPDAAP